MADTKNPKLLSAICEYGCWACLKGGHGYAPAEPHHPRDGDPGMGQKADDERAIPLCRLHHRLIHSDPIWFREKYGTEEEINHNVRLVIGA